MPSTAPVAPPAWVWAASALLALALLGASLPAFLAYESNLVRPASVMEQAIERFADDSPRGGSAWRVIAFGDSALGTATLQLEEMAVYAREQHGLELEYLRLWHPWCQLHDVLPAMNAAIAARPDVVMIDSWALVYAVDRRAAEIYRTFEAEPADRLAGGLQRIADEPSLVLDHQAFLFDKLTGSTDGQIPLPLDPGRKSKLKGVGELRCDAASRRRLLRTATARYPDNEDLAIDPLASQALETILARADARGVRVVFFDIPKAPAIEALPGVRRKRAATREVLRGLVESGRADYLQFPGQIDDDDTCDFIHYAARGRERYLAWFVAELAALHARGSGR